MKQQLNPRMKNNGTLPWTKTMEQDNEKQQWNTKMKSNNGTQQ